MSLEAGARLGPYEIQSILGVGGMGEVYKARDTRLDRIVAIKVLAPAVAADPQFRERFDREARTISQLSHPNICTLHDVGDGFIVMEYLEGETLAARLERGPLPLDEALRVASEISSALDRAHSAGIVHRDLKPGNVMLARTGGGAAPQAKLLDFGLAKQSASAITGPGGAILPVAASGALTAQGLIVGTFQYMAPEQLEGSEADTRADIFAFGAILFEMVTGRKAFEGKTQVSLISAILKDEPPPIASLTTVAPKALDRIIRACLAKDPDARPRHMHDLLMQLKWISEADPAELEAAQRPAVPAAVMPTPQPAPSSSRFAWGLAAMLAIALLGGAFYAAPRMRPAPAADPIQFIVPAPDRAAFVGQVPTFAVSPDGRQIAFVSTTSGPAMLFLRPLASVTARPLAGTEGANYPFWSQDSRFVGFFASGKLRKIDVSAGGSPVDVCDAPNGRGGSWSADNVIVFAPSPTSALQRIAASGGAPSAASTIDSGRKETNHRWPQFLPDGRHFLYLAATNAQPPLEIRMGAIDSKDSSSVLTADSMGVFGSGQLFFWRDGKEMARPFDPRTLQFRGDAIVVADQVGQTGGYTSFSASTNGVIVYARGGARPVSQLTWMDRDGKQLGTVGDPGDYFNIALSPDEKRVAVTLLTGTPENRDVWLIDLARSVSSRLTSDPGNDVLPTWSPDGSTIMFGSTRQPLGIYARSASGSGQDELLLRDDEGVNPIDWSRDGRFILYFKQSAGGFALGVLPTSGDKKPFPLLQTRFSNDHGAFSPDGRWVAYTSTESGPEDVYVQAFPTGDKYRISRNGGTQPMWRGDGKELFFLAADGTMMSATIRAGDSFEAGIPRALFASGVVLTGNRRQYAVAKDGQRFLINLPQQRATATPLTVVVNWQPSTQK